MQVQSEEVVHRCLAVLFASVPEFVVKVQTILGWNFTATEKRLLYLPMTNCLCKLQTELKEFYAKHFANIDLLPGSVTPSRTSIKEIYVNLNFEYQKEDA